MTNFGLCGGRNTTDPIETSEYGVLMPLSGHTIMKIARKANKWTRRIGLYDGDSCEKCFLSLFHNVFFEETADSRWQIHLSSAAKSPRTTTSIFDPEALNQIHQWIFGISLLTTSTRHTKAYHNICGNGLGHSHLQCLFC